MHVRTRLALLAACLSAWTPGCGDDDDPVTPDAGWTADPDGGLDAGPPGGDDAGPLDAGAPDAGPVDAGSPDAGPTVDCAAIDEALTTASLMAHVDALHTVASDNGGTRASSTPGWDASVSYVVSQLEAWGYTPGTTSVDFPFFEQNTDPVLEQTAPGSVTYTYTDDGSSTTADFQAVFFSPSGDVTAQLVPVDLALGADNTSSSGCETEDFTGFTSGAIALVQRGTCPFTVKALNAQAAGAAGMLLFNQGNTTAREGLMPENVALLADTPDNGVDIPVLFATYGVGSALATTIADGSTVTLHLVVDTTSEVRTTENVIADTSDGAADQIVVFGAHLDSVLGGPGINDNATGVAALLEIARAASACEPTRKLRFAFWGAEEWGIWGSAAYVFGLPEAELASIHSYFNVDMIGSPNAVYFVYDGDGSEYGVPGPDGSAEIERFFSSDFLFQGLPHRQIFTDRSDHAPFHFAGVPYGGLFTGAEGEKSEDEVAIFGGTAGEAYDACYHHACDDRDNVDEAVLTAMARSLARAAQFFAVDGSSVPPAP